MSSLRHGGKFALSVALCLKWNMVSVSETLSSMLHKVSPQQQAGERRVKGEKNLLSKTYMLWGTQNFLLLYTLWKLMDDKKQVQVTCPK